MAEHTGIRVSYETVRQVLKAGDIVLSRPQQKVRSPGPAYLVQKRRLKRLATDCRQETPSSMPMSST